MKNFCRKLTVIFLGLVIVLNSVFLVYASEKTVLDMMIESNPLWQKEYVDGIRYIYIVEDGEASIVNIFTNGKATIILPTELGGYPVTKIGYVVKELSNGSIVGEEVFMYYNDGEDISDTFPGYADYELVEYDFSASNKTLVIPEGYQYIIEDALTSFRGRIIFPKSLKEITLWWNYGERIYGENTFIGRDTLIFPECNCSNFAPEYVNDSYILPSRCPEVLYKIRDNSNMNIYNLYTTPKSLCIPNSATADLVATTLYPNGSAYYKGTVIYCAKDSEAYAVIKENGGYTVNTNVPYAEYIEFPEDNVNIRVGDVVDLEAKSYPENATWTACDYTVSDPSIVKIDEYSGRITALKEGTVTVTATHCERGYVDTCTVNVTTKPEPGVNGIEPATDTPYIAYGNRDYKINVTGSPSKIQVVRDNGGTTTIDRRKAQVTSNGDTETWLVNMRVEAGTHNIRAKYGTVWADKLTPFTVEYDLPKAYSFDLTYENGIGTFEVVTDPEVIKLQLALDNGCTLTYSQVYSRIGEDGLRHWTMTRKIPTDRIFLLRTKYGYTWTTTNFEVNTIV